MKWLKTAALFVLLVGASAPAFAQQDSVRGPARAERPARMLNVESALRMRESLKLSSSQIAQLESLRKEIVAQRQNEARDMIELRSRIAAGLDRDDLRNQLESRRTAKRDALQQWQRRLESTLTREQRDQLGNAHRMHGRRMHMRSPRGERARRGPARGFDQRFDDRVRERWRW
jgi:hypothetical protein